MAAAVPSVLRVSVDGKFFRLGEKKFYAKGVAYGPFAPEAPGAQAGFASPEQTARDFEQLRELHANLVRVYHVPPKWFLDLAAEHGLKVLVDIPWDERFCFLDSAQRRAQALDTVRQAVTACGRHPAVFAFSVANEIPPDIVRWSGVRAMTDFIDDLVQEAKRADPGCLCTFTNYPPTEFLRPRSVDFVCFNVYLHHEQPFRNYLARLQMLADSRPLLLGELGFDSLREGEAHKCDMLRWQLESAFRGGLAGAVVFSFTDDWWKDGQPIEDWQMGLTTREREPKPSFRAVQKLFAAAPDFALPRYPKVSVVVACYNGERTLKACLESLQRLHYPDYEVLLVDDGSTDRTGEVARAAGAVGPAQAGQAQPSAETTPRSEDQAPEGTSNLKSQISERPQASGFKARYLRHEKNLGLSVARNTGIAASTGEIIAFIDADCRADEDWLRYLAGDLLNSDFVGIGGPNLLPPEDSLVAASVMASPGGPAPVMLTDRQAEHIPGCNMAFFKWALVEAGGFDPIFHQAGDDVDVCWRLEQAGYKIGLSPAAFVWHYRRSTVGAYLRQQQGYGEAEALLVRKHPEYFNSFGGSVWRGRIYTKAKLGVFLRAPFIYRGLFGSAGFQSIYAAEPAVTLMLCTSLEYYVLVALPLWILSAVVHYLLPLAVTSLLLPVGVCAAAGAQADLPKNKTRFWSRPLVALLFFLQPLVRGWARYRHRLVTLPAAGQPTLDSIALRQSGRNLGEADYASDTPLDRLALVADISRRLDAHGWPNRADIGWSEYDVEVYDTRWTRVQLTTVVEGHANAPCLLRCRLRSRWSLRAKTAFWLLCGLDLLVLGFGGRQFPALWLLLLTLPVLAWLFRGEKRNLQSRMIVFLDEVAKEWKLRPRAR